VRNFGKSGVVLGIIAVALTGSGSAIAANAITGKDVKNGPLTGADVKNRSLSTSDLSTAAISSLKGQTGARGATGATGAAGATGPAGAPAPNVLGSGGSQKGEKGDKGDAGSSGIEGAFYAVANYDVGNTNAGAIATVACDSTVATSKQYVAVSGGVQTIGTTGDNNNNTPVSSSFPGRMDWGTNKPESGRLDGWIVQFAGSNDKPPLKVKVWALCVKTTDVSVKPTYTQSGD
jgi:hypothetical protein